MTDLKFRLVWTAVLFLGLAMVASALASCASTGGAAGIGAAVGATFDGLLATLRASGKIDDATQLAMSQAFHGASDGAVKTAEGLKTLYDAFTAHKQQVAENMSNIVIATKDAASTLAAKIPSTLEVLGLGSVGGGTTGIAGTHLIRGPSTKRAA
jgi:hypothetical protein